MKRNGAEKTSVNEINEKQLFRRLKRGDEEARNKIIQKYNDWVINIAKKFHSLFQNIGIDELIAEGNRGVLDALKRFDFSRNVKFSTYAWFWILKNIKEYITSELAIVDLPQAAMADYKKIVGSINEEAKKGKSSTLETIAKKLKMDLNDVRDVVTDKMNLANVASLDKFLDEEDVSQRLGDMVEDKKEKRIHDVFDSQNEKANLHKVLKYLSPLERRVIRMRFGLVDNDISSLRKVGKKLKISSSKVKDIEVISMRKLKKYLDDRNEKHL